MCKRAQLFFGFPSRSTTCLRSDRDHIGGLNGCRMQVAEHRGGGDVTGSYGSY
jgi:hypothetical protein